MIKGADIDIKDNKGQLPFDYINDVESVQYANELRRLLHVNQSNCHAIIGTQPVQKVSKNKCTMIAFYIFFFFIIVLKIVLIYSR